MADRRHCQSIPKQIEMWRLASVAILEMKTKVDVSAPIAYRTRFGSGREGSRATNGDCAMVIVVRQWREGLDQQPGALFGTRPDRFERPKESQYPATY